MRKQVTKEYYPDPITLDELAEIVHKGVDTFVKNMKGQIANPEEVKFAEDWMEWFVAWLEMSNED